MWDISSLFLAGLVFVLTYYYMKGRKPANFPPGPTGYPFIGNLNLLHNNRNFHRTLHELSKEYDGRVLGLQLGILPVLVVSDVEVVKDILLQRGGNFNTRPKNMTLLKLLYKRKGIVFNNGEPWKILRKMASTALRDFGVGKISFQEKILEETQCLMDEIRKHKGNTFQFNKLFHQAVGNIICSILFGSRFSYDDPEYQQALSALNVIFADTGFQIIFLFLPAVTFPLMPLVQPNAYAMLKANTQLKRFIMKRIQDHRASFDANNILDLIDVFIASEQQETDTKLKSELYSDEQIVHVALDLLQAGSDTSSSTLLWAFYFLIKYPHIQTACRQEIKQVLGEKRPSQQDRKKLPYVEATICEIQRCGNVAPLLLPHSTEEDADVCGYHIPAGTVVMINLFTMFNNPHIFPEPHVFKPERFLDQDGNLSRIDGFIPFGIGTRSCPGENLAKLDIFLFLTTLLQRFEFSAPDPGDLPSMEDTNFGVSHTIHTYDIIAKKL